MRGESVIARDEVPRQSHRFFLSSFLFLLLVAPVIMRNSFLAGKFVTISTNGPVAWQFGNSSDSIGLFVYPKGPLLSPASLDFWKLWGKKTLFFFSSYEWPQNLNIYLLTSITNILKLPLFAFGLIVPLGLVGFFTASNVKFRYLQIYTFAGVISVVAFFITSRFRLPAMAGFILLASGYLYFLFEKILSLRAHFARQSHRSTKLLPLDGGGNKTKSLPLDGGGEVGVNVIARNVFVTWQSHSAVILRREPKNLVIC